MGRRTTYSRKKKGQPATDPAVTSQQEDEPARILQQEDEPATTSHQESSQSIVIQSADEDIVQEQTEPNVEPNVSQVVTGNLSFEAQVESWCDADACDEDSDSECVDFQDEMLNFENIMTCLRE